MVLPAGGQNLGQATARIVLDTSGIQAGITRAQTLLSNAATNIGGSITSIGNRMSGIGAQLSLVTGPLALVGGVGLRAAGDFDAAMAMISARTGLVGEDLDAVRAAAMEMGADTMFSSQQAADGFLQLLTAGLSAEEALETLPAVLNGAAAAGENLGTTADLVTNVMSSFRLSAEDATDIVQTMSAAAASSPASMTEMGQALQSVGGIASTLGLGLDQTSSVLAIFAQNGIRGAEAGTQLRSMLRQMTSDTDAVQGAWSELGVSLFDSQGNMRDLNVVMQELDGALNQLPIEDQNRLMQDLAGSYGIVGFSALRAGVSIEDMMTTMGEQASFMDIAEQQMNTFRGKIISLKGSIETLMISAFTPFMNNVLKPIVQLLIENTNKVTAWIQANQQLTQVIFTVLGVLVALVPTLFVVGKAFVLVGKVISSASTAISLIGKALVFLTSPLGLVVLAVAAFALAWRNNFLGIRDVLEPVVRRVSNAFNLLKQGISQTLSMFRSSGDALASIRFGLTLWVSELLMALGVSSEFAQGVERTLFNLFGRLQALFSRVSLTTRLLTGAFQFFFTNIRNGRGIFNSLRTAIIAFSAEIAKAMGFSDEASNRIRLALLRLSVEAEGLFTRVSEPINAALGVAFTVARDFVDGIRVILSGDFVGGMFGGASEDSQIVDFWFDVRETIIAVLGAIGAGIEQAITVIRPLFGELFTFIGNLLQNIDFGQLFRIGQIILGFTNPIGIVMNILRLFKVDIFGIFKDVIDGITRFFSILNSGGDAFDGLEGALNIDEGALGGVRTVFEGIVSFITDVVIPGLDQLRTWFVDEALPDIITFITNTAIPAIGEFFTFLGNAWETIRPALEQLANWFTTEALPSVIDFIIGTVIPAIGQFIAFLGNVWEAVRPGLEQLANWFIAEALPAIVTFIVGTVIPAIGQFIAFLGNVWESVRPGLEQLANWFITEALPAVIGFISGTVIPAIGRFIQLLSDIWTTVSPFLSQLLDWFITTGLPLAVTFVEETLIPAVERFINLLIGIWEAVSPVLTSLFDWFMTNGLPFIQTAVETLTGIIDTFISTLTTIWGVVEPGLTSLRDGFNTVFGFIGDHIIQPVITLIESIVGIAEDVASRVSGVVGPIGDVIGGVGGFIQDPLGAAGDFIGSLNPFSQGGYTGDAPVNQPTGIVHGQEYVVPKDGALVLERNGNQGGDIYLTVNLPPGINPDNAEETGQLVGGSISEELRRRGLLANGA